MRHDAVPADAWRVPKPFRSFAVRSEEARHASAARTPYKQVHVVRTGIFDGAAAGLAERLAEDARARMPHSAPFDVLHAQVTLGELADLADLAELADLPRPAKLTAADKVSASLIDTITAALQTTGVLGSALDGYQRSLLHRVDYLATRGAGFHNDVSRHWTACLFWNLAIVAADVAFVMPHAGVRVALQPGDLIVFDQTMAHGLCRPGDDGQAVLASFESGHNSQQLFLTGELSLTDAQWAALGAPWMPVDNPAHQGALDLVAAEFDERSGAIQGLRALARCMSPDVSYVAELDIAK